MIDLPWPTITAASGGWILFGLAGWMLLTGRGIVSSREAQSYLTRAEKAEANVEKLVGTVAELTAVSKLQKAVIDAGMKASTKAPRGGGGS